MFLVTKTYLHFAIDGISRSKSSVGPAEAVVTPISAPLSIGTVASHMSRIATNTANDVRGEVALLRAIVLAMSDLTTFSRE